MDYEERKKLMLEAIPDNEVIDLDELEQIANSVDTKDYKQLAGCIIYMREREINRKGRVEAFKAAFPHRCVFQGNYHDKGYESTRKPGDEASVASIQTKAKRLEQQALYRQVYAILTTSLYAAFAVERLKVLEEALDVALDPDTPLRDKDRYMKLFLEETRKPQEAKGLEVNFNVTSNKVNVVSIEDKMSNIARAMNHASATEVLNMIEAGKVSDGDSSED